MASSDLRRQITSKCSKEDRIESFQLQLQARHQWLVQNLWNPMKLQAPHQVQHRLPLQRSPESSPISNQVQLVRGEQIHRRRQVLLFHHDDQYLHLMPPMKSHRHLLHQACRPDQTRSNTRHLRSMLNLNLLKELALSHHRLTTERRRDTRTKTSLHYQQRGAFISTMSMRSFRSWESRRKCQRLSESMQQRETS